MKDFGWKSLIDLISEPIFTCPQTGEQGQTYFSYELIKEFGEENVVFHYDKNESGITAWSLPTGTYWEDEVIWAAHSKAALRSGIRPHARPGWRLGLEHTGMVSPVVTLAQIRTQGDAVADLRDRLERQHGSSLYSPLQVSTRQPLRPVQSYLARLPREMVEMFEPLTRASDEAMGLARSGLLPRVPRGETAPRKWDLRRANP